MVPPSEERRFPPGYEPLRQIGAGGYGEVWLARHDSGVCRAVKVIRRTAFLGHRPFERELAGVRKFQALAEVHPSLIRVIEMGEADGGNGFYYTMELADNANGDAGDAVADYLPHTLDVELARRKVLPTESCVEWGIALASGLESLHRRGLIHRDVKPSNILFVQKRPKLGDVGLVIETAEARSFVGTEGYIPPEGPGTIQADIYSLGMVLFEACTGLSRHDYGDGSRWPKAPSPTLAALVRVIRRACAEQARRRYRSAGEMLADLKGIQRGEQIGANRWRSFFRPGRVWIGAGLLAVGAAGLTWSGKLRPAAASPIPAPPGLVAWWRGEEDAQDSAGDNHGALIGNVGFAPGMVGKAFQFNGTNGYVRIPKSLTLIFTNQVTLELWFQDQSPIPYSGALLSNRGMDEGRFQPSLTLTPDGIAFFFNDPAVDDRINPTAFEVSYAASPLQPQRWHHLAAVCKQAAPNQVSLSTFVNGTKVMAAIRRGNLSSTINDGPFTIGVETEHPTLFFEGLVDEVSVYNRALTDQEIKGVFAAGRAGKRLSSGPRE